MDFPHIYCLARISQSDWESFFPILTVKATCFYPFFLPHIFTIDTFVAMIVHFMFLPSSFFFIFLPHPLLIDTCIVMLIYFMCMSTPTNKLPSCPRSGHISLNGCKLSVLFFKISENLPSCPGSGHLSLNRCTFSILVFFHLYLLAQKVVAYLAKNFGWTGFLF